jgi:hypothetical protein
MPGGELFDGSAHGRLGDGIEFGGQPGFEAGQGFVTLGEQAVVLEQAAQVRDMSARAGGVQTVVAKRNVTGGQAGQQRLDFGGAFPGEDAFGPIDAAEDLNDGHHRVGIGGIVDHQGGEVIA